MVTSTMLICLALTTMAGLTSGVLIIGVLLLTLTIMYSKWIQINSPWIPLIFTLAFLGGMLIIFMYFASSFPTPKSKTSEKPFLMALVFTLMIWNSKSSSTLSYQSSLFSEFSFLYWVVCFVILILLMIATKLIKSPFKALKGAF